ncbi:hypothetical protein TSUD_67580 [Trifolium subterraneum]|uniref:Uncharacterized protein n=1 Tax=Trifolium subterraneum TaxID=3900 RepID=A0A2Z6N4W4_TRISU|nr:hypothetical protein TSUD_67580 [Trifolium subterraneum]
MRKIVSVGEMVTTFAWLDYAKHGWCKFKKEMQVVVVWNIEGMAKGKYYGLPVGAKNSIDDGAGLTS